MTSGHRTSARRLHKNRLAAVLAVVFAFFVIAAAPIVPQSFHPPRTEAEKTLDAILKGANADRFLLDNLFDGRGDKTFRPSFDYSTVLTRGLLASMKAAEKAMVQKSCAGKYSPLGEICGLDYSPITCGQDYEYPYRYRTEKTVRDQIFISFAMPRGNRPNATYRIVKDGKRWKIDGVACGYSDVKFRMN